MSRLDDFEYPLDLPAFTRPSAAEREHVSFHHRSNSATVSGLDRRATLAALYPATFTPNHAGVPRSASLQEQDFVGSDAWSTISPNAARQSHPNVPPSQLQVQPPFAHHHPSLAHPHHHHHASSPSLSSTTGSPASLFLAGNGSANHIPNVLGGVYNHSPIGFSDRDLFLSRQPHPTHSSSLSLPNAQPVQPPESYITRSTLWWGGLEPWMDEEYAKQVCGLMGWNPSDIRVPHPPPDPITGQQPNNPGYCFLTFASPAHAASVVNQVNNSPNGPSVMPNSNKPFALNWATNVPAAALHPPYSASGAPNPNGQRYEKEYSIFVGDLPPEASNSDLVAVFRNPVLGLRNDREPKFVRPFLSCKSAKIMLDPVTGVSRGYGFVRFTDESDQQRALVEMHGLYCLSRPMRISPATAKYKPPPVTIPQVPLVSSPTIMTHPQAPPHALTVALPVQQANKSVSAPIAAPLPVEISPSGTSASTSAPTSASSNCIPGSMSTTSFSSGSSVSTASSSSLASMQSDEMVKMLAQYTNGDVNGKPLASNPSMNSITAPFALQSSEQDAAKYHLSEESWKHHAQARAILSNLIGPNGEQLTSSDPYNTTVFVGGLSPLISEETLRTFFAPFGDIHYVKVPVGKHCGFVQFVHKKDAERAIEKMQGFPIGGSRIRLSWGRSQYKAAQAAAQAAQAAALQAQIQAQTVQAPPQQAALTPEQAIQLLQKFGITTFLGNPQANPSPPENAVPNGFNGTAVHHEPRRSFSGSHDSDHMLSSSYESFSTNAFGGRHNPGVPPQRTTFSPFSPEPNTYMDELRGRESFTPSRADSLSHLSKSFAPGYGPSPLQTQDYTGSSGSGKISPATPTSAHVHAHRPSIHRFNSSYLNSSSSPFDISRAASRSSTRASFEGRMQEFGVQEPDLIQDLNGTLASLDLDNSHGLWKVTDEGSVLRSHGSSPSQ